MVFPVDLVYQDLEVQYVRLSQPETFGISSVGPNWTIREPYDFSASLDTAVLSGGRIATIYLYEEVNGVSEGSVGSGPLDIRYNFQVVVTQGLDVVGRTVVVLPDSPLAQDPSSVYGGGGTSLNFGYSVAGAGDYVVLAAALYDLTFLSGADPYSYGAQWMVLLDCSTDTPVVVDEYLRQDTRPPNTNFAPESDVEMIVSSRDDSSVVITMLNPDSTANPGESTIFVIDVSGGTLNFQNYDGYPTTTGSFDIRFNWDIRHGYGEDSGLYIGNDNAIGSYSEFGFGFRVNPSGSFSFGGVQTSWTHPSDPGGTYYPWGDAGHNVPSLIEPGVFYTPMYRFPGWNVNPIATGKMRYTGSGSIELLDISPPLPADGFSAQIVWSGSMWAWWGCCEHNGKVVTAASSYYYDGVSGQEDLWLIDDTFGLCKKYRVSNISGVSEPVSAYTDFEVSLNSVNGVLYASMNVVDLYDSPALLPGEDYGSSIFVAVINFEEPDLAGELVENRRKFWRPRPGW
jgi:hypothetical protein